ncbi:MAG: phosphoribosyltransferase family protein [Bacteroidales bacterium]
MPLTYFWNWRGNPAEKKLWGRCYLLFIVSLFYYYRESSYKLLLYSIKYKGNKDLAYYLGHYLGTLMKKSSSYFSHNIDYLIPVPLHPRKKRQRGYNQASIIAKGLSDVLKIPINESILYRNKYTKTQTKIHMGNKWENVNNVFSTKNQNILKNKSILIVDDVLTSGSTAEACYQTLNKIKGIRISLATIAYIESD